jgi:3-oxoadipyl-CoA thiolase
MGTVVVSVARTPIGRFQGALSGVRPDDLAAVAIAAAVARAGGLGEGVDEVFFGCANQAGEDNRNVARMAALLAGLPDAVPGVTVNRLCASGLEAVIQGHRAIATGDARRVVVGGVESMSRAPYSLPRGPQQAKAGNLTLWDTSLGWRYPNPRLAARFPLEQMGETAENVAEKLGISRADQDAFAVRSHQRAVAAAASGAFAEELVPVVLPAERSAGVTVAQDEGPRADTSLEALAKLKPAFRAGGTVTAGNASTLNDGAAALVLMDEAAARADGLPVLARIRASASAGVDPRLMGLGPVPASERALARAGLAVSDIDRWELNEAFAAQALGVIRSLGLDEERVNPDGGAIALGHPLGCSGARILATLVLGLRRSGGTFGAASLCVGVGQGLTLVVERV